MFTGTSNDLNENDGGYENITVASGLSLPDLELLRFIHDQITPGMRKTDSCILYTSMCTMCMLLLGLQ